MGINQYATHVQISKVITADEREVTNRWTDNCQEMLNKNGNNKNTQRLSENNNYLTAQCWIEYLTTEEVHPSTQALRLMQGLGRLKKSPPTISVHGLDHPISDCQPLRIPRHSIHPSDVWSSHSPSALRHVQVIF